MEFTDYLLFVVVWIAGAIYGWYARERHAERKLDRFFKGILLLPPLTGIIATSIIHLFLLIKLSTRHTTLVAYLFSKVGRISGT